MKKSDHDAVIKLATNMEHVLEALEKGSKKMDELHNAVDELVNWKSKMVGIAVAVSVIATLIINGLLKINWP